MDVQPEIERWLEQAQNGSAEALGQALEACRTYLLLVAEHEMDDRLRAKGGASDIVQETFIEAQRAFSTFQSESKPEFLAWLRTLLMNNILDFRRRYRETQKRSTDREVALEACSSSADWRGAIIGFGETPSAEFVNQETMSQLQCAIARLAADHQVVINLRYMENLGFEEIGRRMGRSTNAVQKLFARAIDRLQHELESEI